MLSATDDELPFIAVVQMPQEVSVTGQSAVWVIVSNKAVPMAGQEEQEILH